MFYGIESGSEFRMGYVLEVLFYSVWFIDDREKYELVFLC